MSIKKSKFKRAYLGRRLERLIKTIMNLDTKDYIIIDYDDILRRLESLSIPLAKILDENITSRYIPTLRFQRK
jgi:hypothetical protein